MSSQKFNVTSLSEKEEACLSFCFVKLKVELQCNARHSKSHAWETKNVHLVNFHYAQTRCSSGSSGGFDLRILGGYGRRQGAMEELEKLKYLSLVSKVTTGTF